MRGRTFLIAVIGAISLALAGCGTTIAGSPVAAKAVPAPPVLVDPSDANPPESGDLPLPSDSDADQYFGGAPSDMPDLGGLLEGLGTEGMPDLSQLDGLFGSGETADLDALLESLGASGSGGATDFGALLDGLGEANPELAGLLGGGCLQAAGLSMSVGMLMLRPALGQAITQADVDAAFASAADAPAALADSVAVLRAAVEQAVGASAADAQSIMGSGPVSDAMNDISQYLETQCGGS